MSDQTEREYPIPEQLNLALLGLASIASAALLFFASHSESLFVIIASAIVFSFTANTLFSLLHESVHGIFSKRRGVNEWAGRIAAAWFPTGLSLQRAFHLTHHKNNRSYLEQFDVLHEGDVKWLKYSQWYAIYTGIYWAVTAMSVFAYLVLPRMLRVSSLREGNSKVAKQTSSLAYLAALDDVDPILARLEIVLSLVLQGLLFWGLDLSIAGWLVCYAAFALNWSSLQYTDHAFSPLDSHNGAWNLSVGPIGRAFFLNYHSHLAHHQNPRAPWRYLKKLITPGSPQPQFFRVWMEAWRGPRKLIEFPCFTNDSQVLKPFIDLPRGVNAGVLASLAIIFFILFIFFYGGASALSSNIPWRFEVTLPFENYIPFMPEAALVYLSLNVLLGLAPFVLRDWREFFPLFATLVAEMIVSTVFFLVLPIYTTFPERHAEGLAGVVFGIADFLNLEGNFFPSLHVAFAFSSAFAFAPKVQLPGRIALFGWVIAIALSTTLIHEHHILDVIAGLLLALLAWRTVGVWAKRDEVLAAIDIELMCFHNFWLFGRRHQRYWLIALALIYDSLPHWRTQRVLRTGFCFLQQIDDLLDGDRPSECEPLEVVDKVVLAIETGRYGEDDLMRLAKAFMTDMRNKEGDTAIRDVLLLINVMRRDRLRVIDGTLSSRVELCEHHRETFILSIDLMLIARGAELRAKDVPELIDLLGWCSTMRDLREDLDAGLINIPAEVLYAARAEGLSSLSFDSVVATNSVRTWLQDELVHANTLLITTERRLDAAKKCRGVQALRILTRSIRSFSCRRIKQLFPSLNMTA